MGPSEPQEVFRRHLVNVDEYHRMAEIGLFARDARVELIEVWIVDLDHHMLRTYRNPVGAHEQAHYTEVMETASPGVLSPQALPHLQVDLSAVLV